MPLTRKYKNLQQGKNIVGVYQMHSLEKIIFTAVIISQV